MGPSQQKPVSKTEGEEQPKISHQIFGNRKIVKKNEDEQVIVVQVAVPHQQEYTNWTNALKNIGANDSLLLPIKHTFTKAGFCGLSGFVEIEYENYPFLLSAEINNRFCLQSKFFEENELWYLVLTLLTAAQFFHAQNRKVGDIRPENIFISEDGSVKVACIHSWPLERTNYEKSFEKQVTYIAPEEANDIMSFARLESKANFEQAETFSIGLSLLDAATLSDSTDLYKNTKYFNFDGLEDRIASLKAKEQYSRLLKGVIANMCDPSPDNRTSARELYAWLSPFEEEINNFDDFECHQLPPKLRAEIERSPPRSQPAPPLQSPPPPPPPPAYVPVPNTYVSTHFSYQGSSASQPPPLRYQHRSYVPAPAPAPIPGPTYSSSFQQVQFSSKPLAVPPTSTVPVSSSVQSTYVPYNSKFSLDKIDQQLAESRKMFPS